MRVRGANRGLRTLSRLALVGVIGSAAAACSSDASRLSDPFTNPFASNEPAATGSLPDATPPSAPPIRTGRIQSEALAAPAQVAISPRPVASAPSLASPAPATRVASVGQAGWSAQGGTTITVGDNGTVLNLVNGTFETVPTLSNVNLQAIWGTGGTTIAVGEAGTILMNNGGGWTISQQSLTTETLMGVWGTSPTNIFVVGDQGTILHYGPVVP